MQAGARLPVPSINKIDGITLTLTCRERSRNLGKTNIEKGEPYVDREIRVSEYRCLRGSGNRPAWLGPGIDRTGGLRVCGQHSGKQQHKRDSGLRRGARRQTD